MPMEISSHTQAGVAGVLPVGLEADELLLWRRLRGAADAAAREQLLELHMPYARVIAATLYAKRFHDEIEFADYLQLASIGLLEAMDRFDPDRGAQFRTFASRRMRGAVLSGIERLTEKQQQIAARERIRSERVESAKEMAMESSGTGGAVSARTPEQLFRYVSEVGVGLALSWMLEGTAMLEAAERSESHPFYRSVAIEQFRRRLMQSIDALPVQERTVVRSHYMQEIPFDQIAASMNLSKGRISQIHKQALLRLRATVTDHGGLDVSF